MTDPNQIASSEREVIPPELTVGWLVQGALELAYFAGRGSTRKDGPPPDFSDDAKRIEAAAEARGMAQEFTDDEIIDAWGVLSATMDIHTVRLVAKALVRERRAALNGGQYE